MFKPIKAAFAVLPFLVPAVFAGEAHDIAPVIVSATRTAQTADQTLASVTVITRQDIERQQVQSVQDLLRGLPGISIGSNGGAGQLTSVFLRGTESDHVLVLIDGVKVGSATAGLAAFQDVPVDQIERIEIVRGPRSSLYGSEAIGGVIQIFTRKGGGALRPSVSVGAGSDATNAAAFGLSGGGDRGWLNASASVLDTDGFNVRAPAVEYSGGPLYDEPDSDGYRNTAGALRGGYRFMNGVELDAYALRSRGAVEFDGDWQNESKNKQQVLGASLRYAGSEQWQGALRVGRSRDDADSFKDGEFRSRYNTERNTASVQSDLSLIAGHVLTEGFDFQHDSVVSSDNYFVTSRENSGVFLQYQGDFGAHDVQFGVRRDDNQQFGGHTTGNVSWGYAPGEGVRVMASYGTAFKAPNFNELYFPYSSNADLQPEESRSVEVGVSGSSGTQRWSVHAYQTRILDLIANDQNYVPFNISAAHIRGVEATFATRIQDWGVQTNVTVLEPLSRATGADYGKVLPRRATQAMRLDIDRAIGDLRIGATLAAAGKRYDDLANTRKLGGYAIVDLRGEYIFDASWRAQARVVNVFDKAYETAASYNQAGRGLMFTLRYQP